MREWNIRPSVTLPLTLSADVRYAPASYADDQIWELSSGGEPPALALETTYGLRARGMRLFPRFTLGDAGRSDPAEFDRPPTLMAFAPNMARVSYAPFTGIDVLSETWVPESQAIAGRLVIANHTAQTQRLHLQWVAQLLPTEGERMTPGSIEAAPVLVGRSGGLAPVVFLTGGPEAESRTYPALALDLELPPNGEQRVVWSQAACATPEQSFALARRTAARHWDAESARIEMLNSSLVEIYTGKPEWDAAFAFAQRTAFSLFVGPASGFPNPSFTFTRQPDQGYSPRGDGLDYGPLWSGQSPLEAYYLAGLLLPAAPDLVAGLVQNYLSVQDENGFIDWKPGLGGQRSRLLATPLLASLAWKVYETTESVDFLAEVFPRLLDFAANWFSPEHDRDGDGFPEWDHPSQAGLEEHPVYSPWYENVPGVDIQTVESPGLGAMLYHEYGALAAMARRLGREDCLPEIEERRTSLHDLVESTWDSRSATYRDRDRVMHSSPRGILLGSRSGSGEILNEHRFRRPMRVLVQLQIPEESTRRPQVQIVGQDEEGREQVEEARFERFRWYLGRGSLTSELVFSSVERIRVENLAPDDSAEAYSVSFRHEDHSQLLPLWAGIPGEKRARSLVEKTLLNPEKYWRSYGIVASPYRFGEEAGSSPGISPAYSVHLPWNTLIGEGLLRYGYRDEAAALLTRLMDAVCGSLQREGVFRRYYDPAIGLGLGERNALQGLAPIDLFLQVLGVRLISPTRVALNGVNPFPWPVTLKYRGLTVLRQLEKSMVIFPDGQTSVIHDPSPQLVTLT